MQKVIGRLLRASNSNCVFGCKVSQIDVPQLGEMVRISIHPQDRDWVYGLIHDIHIDDDGLIRQLISTEGISDEVLQDNRQNRNVPVEISVLFVGSKVDGDLLHLLPPRPPLTLDEVLPCTEEEIKSFTAQGYGYFRHVLRDTRLPTGEIMAAHLRQASRSHEPGTPGEPDWLKGAIQELMALMKHDHQSLMNILGAVADTRLFDSK